MTDTLVDTSIVIDLLRDYAPAVAWLKTQSLLAIPRVVVLEVIDGAQNKRNLAASLKMLDRFEIVPITDDDVIWAAEQMAFVRLSHHIDPMDALIAAVAQRLNAPLYTRNLKHFAPVVPQLAKLPY